MSRVFSTTAPSVSVGDLDKTPANSATRVAKRAAIAAATGTAVEYYEFGVYGFMATIITGNSWLGLLAAMLAGGAMGLIHAVLSVSLRADQTVSGLALSLFGAGLSGYLGKAYIGLPVAEPFHSVPLPGLSQIPFFGPVLFRHDVLVYLSWVLVLALWFFLKKTVENRSRRVIWFSQR